MDSERSGGGVQLDAQALGSSAVASWKREAIDYLWKEVLLSIDKDGAQLSLLGVLFCCGPF